MHCLSDHYLFYDKIIIFITIYLIVTVLLKFCIPSVSASEDATYMEESVEHITKFPKVLILLKNL